MSKLSRSSFLKSAGAAAGVAAVSASPGVAAAFDQGAVETTPTTALPHEPLVAIVRDERRGEITILDGQTETTYNDHVLVKRLVKASRRTRERGSEGKA